MSIFKALIEENLEIFATKLINLKTCKIGAHIKETTTKESPINVALQMYVSWTTILEKNMEEMRCEYG